jgi:hypothetical protein
MNNQHAAVDMWQWEHMHNFGVHVLICCCMLGQGSSWLHVMLPNTAWRTLVPMTMFSRICRLPN